MAFVLCYEDIGGMFCLRIASIERVRNGVVD